jgi:tetratricopeptide (TPR) repeat protein
VTPCPDETQVAAFVERTLSDIDREALELHVYECESCRETLAHAVAISGAPRQIGRYRLDRVIGSGGMGVVWEAWDPALERRLAIKLLRPEITDDAGRARLLREARALAKLQHPNVVAVHDVGEVDGDVFIATELVDGEPMGRWQLGQSSADVIAAYAQAARGLWAAHRAGLIHRDVKPSNILIGSDGRVRIGDFGLATRERLAVPAQTETGDPRITRDGQIVGTPAYMAPEQRDGKIVDERADQFSFCLALAEALTGARPAAGVTASELAAGGVIAPWPAIARGLAADPSQRYESLEPIVVALDGKQPRRRALIAGVVVCVTLFAGLGLYTIHGRTASCVLPQPLLESTTRTTIAGAFHATKLVYADDAAKTTLAALDAYAESLATEDRRACEDNGEVGARRRACLARVRGQALELVAALEHPDPLAVQRAAAAARGLSEPGLCSSPGALADQTIPADLVVRMHVQLMRAQLTTAATLRHLGKVKAARAIAEKVLAEARSSNLLDVIGEARHELGTILHAQDDPGAEQMLVDGLTAAAEAHADLRAAQISALLVEIVGAKGDVAAAERQATLARPAIIRAGNDRWLDAVVERGLGYANQQANKYAAAADHYKRAEALHHALGEVDDVNFDRRAEVTALGSLDRIAEATKINEAVLADDRVNLGPMHPRTISDLSSRGQLEARAGHYTESTAAFETAIHLDEQVSGPDSAHVASLRGQLGGVYLAMGRIAEAEVAFRATVQALATHVPPDDFELRGERMNLAAVLILLGNNREAVVELEGLVAQASAAKDDESLGLVLETLAEALIGAGKYEDAAAACREAIDRDAKVFGPSSRRGAEAHTTLGTADAKAGRRDAAIAEYKLAIEMLERVDKDTAELGEPLTGLAELTEPSHARPLLERAVKLRANSDPVDLAASRFALGRVLYALHDGNARTEVAAAIELFRGAGDRAKPRRAEAETWLTSHSH